MKPPQNAKPIDAHPDYLVTPDGRVWTTHRKRFLSTHLNPRGYPIVAMRSEYGAPSRGHSLHTLVARHFLPNPEGKPEVSHIDGDKTNNTVDNLFWCTKAENGSYRNYGYAKGQAHPSAKLTPAIVRRMREMREAGEHVSDIARRYQVCHSVVSEITRRKSWRHVE